MLYLDLVKLMRNLNIRKFMLIIIILLDLCNPKLNELLFNMKIRRIVRPNQMK